MIAAVTNQGKVLFVIYPGGGMSPQRLIKNARRKVILILHDMNVQKARVVREWLAQQTVQIEVSYLSPYSPELNLTEYFNGDLKGEIQRGVRPNDAQSLAPNPEIPRAGACLLQQPPHQICRVSLLQSRRVNNYRCRFAAYG